MATIMGLSEKLVLRKASIKNLFELVEFTYDIVSDEIGTKESKRLDTVIFEGTIIECKAYIDLYKEGWFAKLR